MRMAFHQVSPHFRKIILKDGRDIWLSVVTAVSQIFKAKPWDQKFHSRLQRCNQAGFWQLALMGAHN